MLVDKIVLKIFYVSFGLIVATKNLQAVESSVNYRLGTSYTDNSLLAAKNKKDELTINSLVGFSLGDQLRVINYSLLANVNYTNYTKNTLADTTFYRMLADFNWEIIPSSLIWQINNNLSVQEINRLNRPLPTNKQQVNIFSTGPSYIYRLSPINRILLDYRYSDIKYDKKILITNVDNQRNVYKLAVEHKISAASSITLNYDDTAVNYLDETNNIDFTGNSIYLSYNAVKARSTIALSAGVSKAKLVTNTRDYKSDFFNAQWDYQINFGSNLSARYRKGLSDASSDIGLSNFLNSGGVNNANINDSSIFTVERFYLIYNQIKANWKTSYILNGVEQDYDEVRPTQKTLGGIVNFNYNLSRTLVLTSSVSQVVRKSLASNEIKTNDRMFSIGTRYYISTNLQFITQYRRNNRTSNQVGRSYDENVLSLSLTYSNAPLAVVPQR